MTRRLFEINVVEMCVGAILVCAMCRSPWLHHHWPLTIVILFATSALLRRFW